MSQAVKTIEATLQRRNTVKLPAAFIEESVPDKSVKLNVHYGKNYSCVIIVPKDVKLSDNAKSRMAILVNELLT